MGQIVKENIDFKRGRASRRALEVGSYYKLLPPFIFGDIPDGIYLATATSYNNEYYNVILKFEGDNLIRLTSWEDTIENIFDPDFRLDYPDKVVVTDMYPYTWWLKNENITSLKRIDDFKEIKES